MAEGKKRTRGMDTRLFLFYAGCAIFNIGSNTAHPVTPTIFTTLGLGSYMFGLALAAQLTTNFLFSPFWGWLSTYISNRRALLITCVGYGLGQILFGLSKTELAFIVARALTGIFCGGCFVCIMAYIVNTAPDGETRGRWLTTSATLQTVCGAFGYFIGGMLGEIFPHLAIIFQVGFLFSAGVIFYMACSEDAVMAVSELKKKENRKGFNPFVSFINAKSFLTPVFALLFMACLLQNLGFTTFDQTFNYYIRDQFNFSSGYNGILKGIMGLITLAANSTICIWLIRRTDIRKSSISVFVICSLSILGVVVFSQIIPFVIVNVLFFAFHSVSLPLLQTLVAEDVKSNQSSLVMGFYNAVRSLGGIAGALFSGLLYTAGPKFPFIFGFGAFILAAALLLLYWRKAEAKAAAMPL